MTGKCKRPKRLVSSWILFCTFFVRPTRELEVLIETEKDRREWTKRDEERRRIKEFNNWTNKLLFGFGHVCGVVSKKGLETTLKQKEVHRKALRLSFCSWHIHPIRTAVDHAQNIPTREKKRRKISTKLVSLLMQYDCQMIKSSTAQ